MQSLDGNTTGNNNIGLGYYAGAYITTGSYNIAIGNQAQVQFNTGSNQLSIGNWIFGDNGNIGIGTGTALTAKLTVAGQVQITGGTPGAGKVLTSDASGLASWSTPSGWGLTGNAGTTAGTNFLGTTDNVDVVFKSNNTERMRITGSSGNIIGLGSYAPVGTNSLSIGNGAGNNMTGSSNTALGGGAAGNYMQGTQNTAIGGNTVGNNMRGTYNTALGGGTAGNYMYGSLNTAIGGNMAGDNMTGSSNTAIGGGAAGNYMQGTQNTAIG